MDLSKVVQYDELYPVKPKYPSRDENGYIVSIDAGITLYVASFEGRTVARASNIALGKKIKAKLSYAKDYEFNIIEAQDDEALEKAIQSVQKWDWGGKSFGDLPADPECTRENVEYVLTHPNAAWILKAVVEAAANIENFIPSQETPA